MVGTFDPDETRILATHTRTTYAVPEAGTYLHDRVAQVRSYELADPPTVAEPAPADLGAVLTGQVAAAEAVRDTFERLDSAEVRLVEHVLHHYDGPGLEGGDVGSAGRYGALTRSESLIFTDDVLDAAYGDRRPRYLGGSAALPQGAPPGFGASLGYRREAAGPVYAAGWYADTLRQRYDFQASTTAVPLPERGVVVGVQDPLGNETTVTLDPFWLMPRTVRDPAGLETTADYDYRVGQPARVTDPNGNATNYRYHPLGLLSAVFLQGRSGQGGTADQPEIRYTFDFQAFTRPDQQPIHVHTTQRIQHLSESTAAETIESREYSDGFGRLIQRRAQADELAFGAAGDDVGLLVQDPTGTPRPVPGRVDGPASGTRVPDRVVVSGWQVYDNKGRVVEKYQPFFDRGWEYQPEAAAKQGRRVLTFYDPRGQPIRVVNPDGSELRTIFGIPADLTRPDEVEPTQWVVTTYDSNDLAPVTAGPGGATLAAAAPPAHHYTPATTVVDALGRTICRLARNGADAAADTHATRTAYDLRGNVVAVTDALGRVAVRQDHDLANRPLRADSIDAGVKTSVLNAVGGVVEARDSHGCMTLWSYDALNRVSQMLARDRPAGRVTVRERIVYGDGSTPGQPATDRAAARASNRLGRPWRHYDEAGVVVFDAYDFKGNVSDQTRQVVGDAALAAGWTANWAAANAEAVLDPVGYRTETRYDALNREVAVMCPADAQGHRAQITLRYGRSGSVRAVELDGSPYVRLIAHNAQEQRVLIAYGNGLMTRCAYDPDSFRLVRVRSEGATAAGDTWTGGTPVLQDLTYTYDLVGNLTAVEERTSGCGVAVEGRDRLVNRFAYDPLYRLTTATGRACADIARPRGFVDSARCGAYPPPYRPPPPVPNQTNGPDLTERYTETFDYDPVGSLLRLRYTTTTGTRRTWVRRFGVGGRAPDGWARARSNQVTSVVTGGSTSTLAYDANGNLLRGTLDRELSWDHAARLVSLRTSAGAGTSLRARYLYGADGLRVKKWVRRGPGAARDESIVYIDGFFEHQRWALGGGGENVHVQVLDDTSRVVSVRAGLAHPRDAGPPVAYELADHLGSSAVVVDERGQWVNREEYFAYGETSFGGFARKRYRFMGQERDEESGLSYHTARYYAPWLAKWVSCDPAGMAEGTNLYWFAVANPVTFKDPTGTQSERPQVWNATDAEGLTIVASKPAATAAGGGRSPPSESPPSEDPSVDASQRFTIVFRVTRKPTPEIGDPGAPQPKPNFDPDGTRFSSEDAERVFRSYVEMDPNPKTSAEQQQEEAREKLEELRRSLAEEDPEAARAVFGDDYSKPEVLQAGAGLSQREARALLGLYNSAKGHHIHAVSAFLEHATYNPQWGFSISQEFMEAMEWSHTKMTNRQRELFKELLASGRPNTLKEHSKIAVEALMAGGATEAEARALVAESLLNLRAQGVRAPTRIPWSKVWTKVKGGAKKAFKAGKNLIKKIK